MEMIRPDLEDSKYWSPVVKGDGKKSSWCLHETYQRDLNEYIDYLLSVK